MWRRAVYVVVVASLCLARQPSLAAWEKDTHYGLTLWLGLRAGFSLSDAKRVAELTQGDDEGFVTPATMTESIALLIGDVSGARLTGRRHFPTSGAIPGEPAGRAVVPNSPAARHLLDAAIAFQGADELDRLGEAFHPFQDSWSHQGIPDTPLRPGPAIRRLIALSHPAARGGWRQHNADLTYRFPQDALDTGRATFEAMCAFLKTHPRRAQRPCASWSALEADVRSFARASTRDEKRAWFAAHLQHASVDLEELVNVSLPGQSKIRERLAWFATWGTTAVARATTPGRADIVRAAMVVGRGQPAAPPPPQLVERAQQFVALWLRDQNIDQAIQRVAWRALQAQFGPEELDPSQDAIITWCRRFMTMWLVDDHGAIERAGHCDPKAAGYDELPQAPPREGPMAAGRLEMKPLLPENLSPVRGAFDGDPPAYAFVVQFTHHPRDSVVIVMRPDGQIIRMLWLVA